MKSEANECVIRDHDNNLYVADRCGSCGDDKVKDVVGVVSRLGDVLNAVKRLQQISKTHAVDVFRFIDVDITAATYDDWTSVDSQQLENH